MTSISTAISAAAAALGDLSASPRLDAELLMAHALGVDRNTLILSHMNDLPPPAFSQLVSRRQAHEPVAYIIGERDFWTITLKVAPGVLIPRADSETLIEAALAHFAVPPASILDLGTGPGTLLLAALSEWPEAKGLGVDASPSALAIAEKNARRLGLSARFQLGDWAEALQGQFDLILCNPPYVEEDAELDPQIRSYEPHSALFAGADGLDDYRRIAPQLPALIADGGCAILEIGHAQAPAVTDLLAAEGLKTAIRQDLGGRDRAVIATK